MEQLLDIDKVQNLGIFELRALARQLGVSSPTTKKREELVSAIVEASASNEKRNNSGKRKGRPYKELSSLKDIWLEVNTEPITTDYQNIQSYFAFEQPKFGFLADDRVGGKISECQGYIRQTQNVKSFYDIKSGEWVFVRSEDPYFDALQSGDKVKVVAKDIKTEGQKIIDEILEINDIKANDYHFVEPSDDRKEVIGTEKLVFDNKYLYKGRRNTLSYDCDIYESNEFASLLEACEKENINLIVLGLNISFEDEIYLRQFDKVDKFVTLYGSNDYLGFNVLIDAVNYAQRLKKNNEKVLLYVVDLPEVIRLVDRYSQKNYEENYEHTKIILKEIMSIAQAFDDGYSSSVLMRYHKDLKNNEFLKAEVLRVSKDIN